MTVTASEVAQELLLRREARRCYKTYLQIVSEEGELAAHHLLMVEKLQAVADGKIKRLMLFFPPGAAKSFYGNVNFSAWWMGRNPKLPLLTSSFGQEVADKWGRRVKNVIRSDGHQRIFNKQKISRSSDSASRWALEDGGEYYAVGAGGAITSYRADLAIIDDPIKGREYADSVVFKKKLREWYKSDFWTRLKPNAAVVLIMTRWAEDDLAGFLLEQEQNGGEKWEVVSVPMEAQEDDILGRAVGERLWSSWFTEEMVTEAKRDARNWSCLYQQNPIPQEGLQFKAEWIKRFRLGEHPANCRYYLTSDFAVTPQGGDYTELAVVAVDAQDNWYVVDWWYGQTTPDIWIDRGVDFIKAHKPLCWFAEAGVIRRSVEPFLTKRMQETRTYSRIEWTASIADKPTRARGLEARLAMGKVFIAHSEWGDRLIEQLLRFPAGKYDDAVDALSIMAMGIDKVTAGYTTQKETPKQRRMYDREETTENWKVM
jgi:predicted phage terminase large subunit-like protein